MSHHLTLMAVYLYWTTVAKHPLPVHRRHFADVRDVDRQAKYCIKFLRENRDSSLPKYYTFNHEDGANISHSSKSHP